MEFNHLEMESFNLPTSLVWARWLSNVRDNPWKMKDIRG